MAQTFKTNNNVVYSCKYHVVWCPKYCRKVLIDGVDIRLKEILHEVVGEATGEISEIEVTPDQVHVWVEIDPQHGIAKLVRNMKGRSSRLLRQEFPWLKSRLPTLWTNKWLVETVGGASTSVIRQYVEKQRNV